MVARGEADPPVGDAVARQAGGGEEDSVQRPQRSPWAAQAGVNGQQATGRVHKGTEMRATERHCTIAMATDQHCVRMLEYQYTTRNHAMSRSL